jgi:hypothetical protein
LPGEGLGTKLSPVGKQGDTGNKEIAFMAVLFLKVKLLSYLTAFETKQIRLNNITKSLTGQGFCGNLKAENKSKFSIKTKS